MQIIDATKMTFDERKAAVASANFRAVTVCVEHTYYPSITGPITAQRKHPYYLAVYDVDNKGRTFSRRPPNYFKTLEAAMKRAAQFAATR